MTTPPKARRFHLSASESVRPGAPAPHAADTRKTAPSVRVEVRKKTDLPPRFGKGPVADEAGKPDTSDAALDRLTLTQPTDDGFPDRKVGEAPSTAAAPAQSDSAGLEARLRAIRSEKLTDRQLRIARRIAALHQIEVASDEEAVLRLRERGIDPSHRAALSQILSSEGNRVQSSPTRNAPAVLPRAKGTEVGPAAPPLPSREALAEDQRAADIYRIQRDIARRRRRRMMMLALRLLFFVVLPTALAGWYYFRVATPLYATFSQFQIQFADTSGLSQGGNAIAGLQANSDAVGVQSYLSSRDAMLRLDADKGFKRAFQDPSIDPVKRLAPDATNEAAYKVYQDSVRIGYDPTEGMIDMEVIAPDPALSQEFSLALIAYAEDQVDQMTERMRADQMEGAVQNYRDAEERVVEAQRRVQELQQNLGVLDPVAEGSVVMNQIAELEGQLAQRQLELGQLLANQRPQQSRVATLRGDISRLQDMIAQTRGQLTNGNETRTSLAAISGELRIAESDLATRQELMANAAAQMETARITANKQVRYLSLSVKPVAPDEATYPKAFQNTLVALLIFSGIYLMLSLTASILREQVSS
jgi:capsular polysaccharide transport system permease protein